ncbi:ABC transporter permease [Anaerocolumna cellulosilytica]|uniref:ABC transporter permease n=1 Tax=Anaerocolumna cellulosilytica TaxID=433286 RepID=A0A6S6QVP2_9FIRM|nr:FtsX-like permease family protein [Anaerocolumna cellulosilytica]MBB5197975.1 ABC-type antimicrobial peptide transport system permease subunit [Anaerocolumna cellulosilytica]BCJ93139.1 ABC transporter permease [Anaerocolumna cellulosilytica]
MRISDLIKMGLRNLSRRKARTALTIIGVIIGTLSIVVMISIGIGMNTNFKSQVMELGSLTTITVEKYANIMDSEGNYVSSKEQLMDDALVEQIKGLEHVKAVSPVLSGSMMLKSGKYENYTQVYAMDSSTLTEFDFPELTMGTYPTPEANHFIIFGSDVMKNFYNPNSRNYTTKEVDITKDKITLQFDSYRYAVNDKKKAFSLKVTDYAVMEQVNNYEYDYFCYMDINYFKSIYKKYLNTLKAEDRKKAKNAIESYERINITVDNIKNVTKVQDAIKELGFQTSSLAKILEPMQETSNMMQMVLGGIGAVAMLVSAINIANTMIMSIYERTKEIGIMKVLGCIIHDIKKLFLFEAGMIGLMGGIVGIILSYVASWAINKFGQPLFKALLSSSSMYSMESAKFSVIPLWLPLVAAGFAMLVGIVSGYYPANRATKISAIEAMKTDG